MSEMGVFSNLLGDDMVTPQLPPPLPLSALALRPTPAIGQPMRDLARILELPRRPVLDCERERIPGVRRWTPEAQALIDVVTAKYTRGPRLSCGCRDRHVIRSSRDTLTVLGAAPPRMPPPPPLIVSVDEFCRDNSFNDKAVEAVRDMRVGETRLLPGIGDVFCITEFNPAQAWILWETPRVGGCSGFISVGFGKTLSSIMVPMSMSHVQKWAVFIKPDQRIHYRDAYLRAREHFVVPTIVFDRSEEKSSYIVDGVPSLHVVPYSHLSNTKSTQYLEMLDPDGAIFDESHLLANKKSSRTMRVLRYLASRNQQKRYVAVCDWSGSKVKKSLKDCSHLSAHALGMGSPYPIIGHEIDAWSDVVDPLVSPDRSSPTARSLLKAFGDSNIDEELFKSGLVESGIREGHRDRVIATPGIISTKSSSITCSITIKEHKPETTPAAVREVLKGIRSDSLLKVGDFEEELTEATQIAMTARTVGSGYYAYWAFPHSTLEDRSPGGKIDKWYAARKRWNREVRAKLQNGEPHLDSYKLCENAAERAWREPRYDGDLPVWPAESWPAWRDIKDTVEYDERTRWIDDFLARDAAKWAKEHVGVVWCLGVAFGKKVAELAGINYHGGGQDAEARIKAESGKRSIVCSIKAHGESRDGLQYKFSKQLAAELPASGDRWEQLLGRLAREGQTEDTVETWVYRHTSENREAFRQAQMLAEYIEQTTPNKQLLRAADIEFD